MRLLVLVSCTLLYFAALSDGREDFLPNDFDWVQDVSGCWKNDWFDYTPDYDTDHASHYTLFGTLGGVGRSLSHANFGYFYCNGEAWERMTPGQIVLNTTAVCLFEDRWTHDCDGGHARLDAHGKVEGIARIVDPGGSAYAIGLLEVKCQQLYNDPLRILLDDSAVAWDSDEIITLVSDVVELTPNWSIGTASQPDRDQDSEDQADCVGSYLSLNIRTKSRNGVLANGSALSRSIVNAYGAGILDRCKLTLKDECN